MHEAVHVVSGESILPPIRRVAATARDVAQCHLDGRWPESEDRVELAQHRLIHFQRLQPVEGHADVKQWIGCAIWVPIGHSNPLGELADECASASTGIETENQVTRGHPPVGPDDALHLAEVDLHRYTSEDRTNFFFDLPDRRITERREQVAVVITG